MAKRKKIHPPLSNYDRKIKDIKADYLKMKNETTDKGTKKYTLEYMLEKIADKYYLSEKHIYKIITSK